MSKASDRLKTAIEEVAFLRTQAALTWSEKVDLDARIIEIGFVSHHEAQTLGRKLKNPEEIKWEEEAEAAARERNMAPMPYPRELLVPVGEERVEFYRLEILSALLRSEAVNVKF